MLIDVTNFLCVDTFAYFLELIQIYYFTIRQQLEQLESRPSKSTN